MQNSQFETSAALGGSRTRAGGGGRLSGAITLILLVLLILVALLLPPINLLERLQALTYTRVTPAGGMLTDPDGTTVVFPAEGVSSSFFAKLESTPRADFIAGEGGSNLYDAASNLPQYLIPKSPYYRMDVRGPNPTLTELDIPIPNDSLPYETLGLYNWNGSEWHLVPNQVLVAEDKIVASVDYPPTGFMVMQTTPGVPAITANLGQYAQLPQGAVVTYEAKAGLLLRGDGALDGVAPVNSGNTLPIIRNWEGEVVRTDLINNLLIDPGLQANQLVAVEQTVVQNGYPGVIIDYRGVDALPSARADYVRLISDLADRIHAAGKTLAVRVEPPHQISAEKWDTGGYDWRHLGEVVDTLVVPAPIDPRAYGENGELDALLTFATSEVDRNKLQIELPSYSIARAGSYLLNPEGFEHAPFSKPGCLLFVKLRQDPGLDRRPVAILAQPGDIVLIVQGGIGDDHTANSHRPEPRYRRQCPGAANLYFDFFQNGCRPLGRKLVGNGPARRARHKPQPFLIIKPLDLVDHPVNVIAKRCALLLKPSVIVNQITGLMAHLHQIIDRQPPALERRHDA